MKNFFLICLLLCYYQISAKSLSSNGKIYPGSPCRFNGDCWINGENFYNSYCDFRKCKIGCNSLLTNYCRKQGFPRPSGGRRYCCENSYCTTENCY